MDTGFEVQRRREAGETIQVAQAFFEQRGYGIDSSSSPIAYASLSDSDTATPFNSAVSYVSGEAPTALPTDVTPPPSARAPAPARRSSPPAAPAGRYSVQVGAFREETVARDWLKDVSRRFRSEFQSASQDVQTANGWYRSRFTGMTQTAAEGACKALAERRVTCMVVRPS